MDEKMVKISFVEYKELIAKSERIAAVERLVNKSNYVSTGDIMIVLGLDIERRTDDVQNG